MRRSPAYEGLPLRSRALVDHLVDAVLVNGEPNGWISRIVPELMATLDTRSRKQFYKAVNAAIGAEIVVRGSRALSHGMGSGSSNLWGLACLPRMPRAGPGSTTKPSQVGGRSGGTKWPKGDEVGVNPLILLGVVAGSYTTLWAKPRAQAPRDRRSWPPR